MSKKTLIILSVLALILILVFVAKKTKIFSNYKAYDRGFSSGYRYFLLSEFDSPANFPSDDGKEVYTKNAKTYIKNSGKENMNRSFLTMLDTARNGVENTWNLANPLARIVFKINSGFRTVFHNSKVGGVTGSSHVDGYASDINTTGYSVAQKQAILRELYKAGFRRFGIGVNIIHVDNDPTKPVNSVWNYGSGYDLANYEIEDIEKLVA